MQRNDEKKISSRDKLIAAATGSSGGPYFKKATKTIVKQLVNVRVLLEVTEYQADVYYNLKTGERIHAEFPCGIVEDVNYGGSVKAFLFLLNHDCCTSIDKSRKFLSDLTKERMFILVPILFL